MFLKKPKMKHLTLAILMLAGLLNAAPVIAREEPATTTTGAAQALIERLLPSRLARRFTVEPIPASGTNDVYEIESCGDRVVLRGNNGVAIASALNRYLKDYCHCDVSWGCGDQLKLPSQLPAVTGKIRAVSPCPYRYAYNFCTFGYTMTWWRWPQWERELDFLALNGINLALVIEGQESVWINTFTNAGFSAADIRGWMVDPAHQPWMAMDNMESYGGPLSAQLVERRLDLGRKIISRMRELGIRPVLPGYYGMVPPDFHEKFPQADVRPQGNWAGLRRPDILNATDPMFATVAKAYYAAEDNLFGGAHFYDADPFHEGGSAKDIDLPACGRGIQKAMGDATWVLQSWWANPHQEMVDALDKNQVLVLDLHCEEHENWRQRNNFNGSPWIWCAINCFGGNMKFGGRLAWMAEGPAGAQTDANKGRWCGIGAIMEATGVNPVLWEMLLEGAWRTNAPDLQPWLDNYAWRRYGAKIPAAEQAWKILAASVYTSIPTNKDVICLLPSLRQSARGPDANRHLAEAWRLLLAAAPEAGASAGYRFDLAELELQVLANLGACYDREIIAAYQAGDAARLRQSGDKMLALIRDMDELAGTQSQWLLGVWLADARSWGAAPAEKDLCERNSRELLTLWTRSNNIPDYANRRWNGLLGDYYHHRWAMWLQALDVSLAAHVPLNETGISNQIQKWESSWTLQTHGHYAAKPTGNWLAISKKLYTRYAPDALALLPADEKSGE
jgi:alpha-N-acetylglucosaminidase